MPFRAVIAGLAVATGGLRSLCPVVTKKWAPFHRHLLLIRQTPPTAFAGQNTAAECAIRKFSSPGLIGLIVRATRPFFCEAAKARGLSYGGSSCRASRWW